MSAAAVNGLVHATFCDPTTQRVVVGDPPVVNPNVGVLSLVGPLGPDVIETVGATVSTEKARVADPLFPTASVTVTVNV
jgi:hypothetical protein